MKYQVTIDEKKSFDCADNSDLISAAKAQNVAMPSGCCGGECGGCVAKLTSGEINYQSGYQAKILSKAQQDAGMIVCCMAEPKSDLSLVCQQQDKIATPEQKTMQVVAKNQLSDDVLQLVLSSKDQQKLTFRAGQFVEILLAEGETRCYSIANADVADSQFSKAIELHIKQRPQGLFSDITCNNLSIGEQVELTMPLGNFYWRKELNKPIILAATGTGFAPIQGILQEIFHSTPEQEIHFYWGCRDEQDLYAHQQLLTWQKQFKQFHYTPVLSQANDSWQGHTGHIHQAIVGHHTELSSFVIYLAGSEIMIKKTRQVLSAFGMNQAQLFCDLFLPATSEKSKSNLINKIMGLFGKKSSKKKQEKY
ncbi:MAG: 2Fe-2S iron-sulfur cluster binding domain-containing protein [Colwellia sp.]|nr:2Fe-2S iron-sulfur cluster binding domain-containing protein [Colwellia sp.]